MNRQHFLTEFSCQPRGDQVPGLELVVAHHTKEGAAWRSFGPGIVGQDGTFELWTYLLQLHRQIYRRFKFFRPISHTKLLPVKLRRHESIDSNIKFQCFRGKKKILCTDLCFCAANRVSSDEAVRRDCVCAVPPTSGLFQNPLDAHETKQELEMLRRNLDSSFQMALFITTLDVRFSYSCNILLQFLHCCYGS